MRRLLQKINKEKNTRKVAVPSFITFHIVELFIANDSACIFTRNYKEANSLTFFLKVIFGKLVWFERIRTL